MQIQVDAWYFTHKGDIVGPMQRSADPGTFHCGDSRVWNPGGVCISHVIGSFSEDLVKQLPFGVKGPTIKTCTGRIFNLIDPHPEDIVLRDIALPLSRVQRWGGQYASWVDEYSVAAHSLNCVRLGRYLGYPRPALLAILLHDAAEAYVGDLVKPLKMLCESYSVVENRIQAVIAEACGCDFALYSKEIETVDHAILVLEKNTIINGGEDWIYTFEKDSLDILPRRFNLLYYPRRRLSRIRRFVRGSWSGGDPVREFIRTYQELGGDFVRAYQELGQV